MNATQRQARRLKELGFRVWARQINPAAPAGKRRKPTMKWIRENISIDQAGAIMRALGYDPKDKWKIKQPERPFLETRDKQLAEISKESMARMRKKGRSK